MNLKTIDFVYKWTIIKNAKNTDLKNSISGFIGNNILGYVYIDKQTGITLDVYYLFDFSNPIIQITDSLIDKKIRLMLRYGSFIKHIEILQNNIASIINVLANWRLRL